MATTTKLVTVKDPKTGKTVVVSRQVAVPTNTAVKAPILSKTSSTAVKPTAPAKIGTAPVSQLFVAKPTAQEIGRAHV